MIKVGIVGATGYTGEELMRLLVVHPQTKLEAVTSRRDKGVLVAAVFPSLELLGDLTFSSPDLENLLGCDLVFLATPHGVAQSLVPDILKAGIKVIDLSADFRIRDIDIWELWYKQRHLAPGLSQESVYGLPEFNREKIRVSNFVACAGCYPTSIQMGLLPLLIHGHIETTDIVANSASGISGAGRQANNSKLLSEARDSFKAYAGSGHRHLPEIEQGLSDIAGESVKVTFVPHLLPIDRGIHSTIYASLKDPSVDVQTIFEKYFEEESFVKVLPAGSHPDTGAVKGSNFCHIAVHRPSHSSKVIICVTLDNLTKGASGQAVQCMNVMFNIPEVTGLTNLGLLS
jgi:N-acetyl-gamma-glutamyl-phosphate reductase